MEMLEFSRFAARELRGEPGVYFAAAGSITAGMLLWMQLLAAALTVAVLIGTGLYTWLKLYVAWRKFKDGKEFSTD